MSLEHLAADMEQALDSVPILDAHTHLVGGHLGARGLHDILLYHMVISDLYAAGCPTGARLTEYPGWPTDLEARARIEEAIPFLAQIRNTSSYWGVRIICSQLYDWHEPITAENWQRLDAQVRERAADASAPYAILDQLGIERTVTELARRGNGQDDDRLQYALEWGFFTRSKWGEFDTALYELERCWGRAPESPTPVRGGSRPAADRTIQRLEDVHAAIGHYVETIPYDQVLSTTTHLSTDIDLRVVDEAEMATALERRAQAGPQERDVYAAYINEAFLTALEERGSGIVLQFSYGAEPLPFESASRLSQQSIAQVAEMVARHPQLHFQCFVASRHANQSLCTLGRELPNFSLIGYWWHNFFPDTMRQIMAERLDMLPLNKQIGFFSDTYCIEWTLAKAVLVRRQLARVLAEKIQVGQYSRDEALSIARAILYETPQSLLGMVPRRG